MFCLLDVSGSMGEWEKEMAKRFFLLLYLFLVLVSDRHGLSYYSYDKICTLLRLCLDEYVLARDGLIAKDLLAFDGYLFQVLSLPAGPKGISPKMLRTPDQMLRNDPATIFQVIRKEIGAHVAE